MLATTKPGGGHEPTPPENTAELKHEFPTDPIGRGDSVPVAGPQRVHQSRVFTSRATFNWT